MLTFARACLTLALLTAGWGVYASMRAARSREERWAASGRRALYAVAALLVTDFALLESAFVRSDFSVAVVARHASTTTPPFYRATAIWSSQEGSLLLWAMLLALWSTLAVRLAARRLPRATPWATATLLSVALFFVALSVFWANPFQLLDPAPPEGAGLEPLLRHPAMMFHPPLLYSGYTMSIVPFAFAVGALIARQVDVRWTHVVRRFALGGWMLLGLGMLLGSRWSWTELGWGGYWAWDPVENAALMPWLTATAFVHSTILFQRRGLLKAWTVGLAIATGVLALLGTFLVRSGLLTSIHAFGASTLGAPFVAFIALVLVASTLLMLARTGDLAPEHRLRSLWSREGLLVANNVLLVGLCLVVLWGTFFPVISEAVTGSKASVGPPWFERYTVPLAIAVVAVSGLASLMAWQSGTRHGTWRTIFVPLLAALAVTTALAALPGVTSSPPSLALFGAAAFVIVASTGQLVRAVRTRRLATRERTPLALTRVIQRNRRRYGGYLVHVGVAVLLIGVAASSGFERVRDVRLGMGQHARVGGYEISYRRATGTLSREKVALGAVLDVTRQGHHVTTLQPTRGYYPNLDVSAGPISRFFNGESTSAIGLRPSLGSDLWAAIQPDIHPLQPLMSDADKRFLVASPNVQALVVAGLVARYEDKPPPAVFRVIVAPLVEWIWLGGIVAIAGGVIAIWPSGLAALLLRLPARLRPYLRRFRPATS